MRWIEEEEKGHKPNQESPSMFGASGSMRSMYLGARTDSKSALEEDETEVFVSVVFVLFSWLILFLFLCLFLFSSEAKTACR